MNTDMLIPVVAIIALFTFITVATWAENRRKEREAFYRSETLKKAIEQSGDSMQQMTELLRSEERRLARRRIDGLRLGGLILIAAGVGSMIFLRELIDDDPIWLGGLVALLIGVVLAGYSFFMPTDDPTP